MGTIILAFVDMVDTQTGKTKSLMQIRFVPEGHQHEADARQARKSKEIKDIC